MHVVGKFFASLKHGEKPFAHMSPASVIRDLRSMLSEIGVRDATAYITHDLRRGHAEDLRLRGATLGEILRAGDWRSPAFLHYLNIAQLESDRTAEAHLEDSSDRD